MARLAALTGRWLGMACVAIVFVVSPGRQAWAGGQKTPVELEMEATGPLAEEFSRQIQALVLASEYSTPDNKRVPRIAISVNAHDKTDAPAVTYCLVLSVVTAKCPPAYMGVIFGDTAGEDRRMLSGKIEKAVMAIARKLDM